MFNVSPMGKLLNPFIGAVQNEADQTSFSFPLRIKNESLSDSVEIFFDKRKVPHIYAQNTNDLYFAQGYVASYLRLWQMDFLSYVSAGRLSEIFNKEEFLDYDRNQRRIGILESAKSSLKLIEEDLETKNILTAYTNGVNAYIKSMTYKDMPFEYKLLDYKPEAWSNLKSVLLLKQMGNTLSGYEEDAFISKMILALGEDNFNLLFPDLNSHITPITGSYRGKKAAGSKIEKPDYLDFSFLFSNSIISKSDYNPKLGSNSWAVSGKKTKSGYPILCTDPHLGLSLPSTWVEMQLSTPEMNVYGVSIPGTPSIIMGFNENIAWGTTNGAEDVKDWYKLKISNDYKKYEYDGNWLAFKIRVEEIKRKNQKPFLDTVYSTIHGPVVINRSFPNKQTEYMNYAMKWELHNASNEFKTFIKLNVAKNYKDYKDALKYYSSPIQNFTFASRDNDIAINHQGSMAVKWKGQGKFILDGSKKSHLYTQYIPFDSLPHLLNPSANFVFSANQRPTDSTYPYYYNGYYSESRAHHIKKALEKESKFDIPKMQALQLDNTSDFATEAVSVLIKKIDEKRLSKSQLSLLMSIGSWNGRFDFNDKSAKVFDLWWSNIVEYTFDELKRYYFNIRPVEKYAVLDLIEKDSSNEYFDKVETMQKETLEDIITQAFIASCDEYLKTKDKESAWGNFNRISILHMTKIPAFSIVDLPSSGHPDAINAIQNNWGPSWRMVVELGDRPKAYGIYPGGQSGNTGSSYYDNFVKDWNKGKYYPLHFFMSIAEAKSQSTNSWILHHK